MQTNLGKELESSDQLTPPLASVGSILPTIGFTSRRLKQLNSVVLIREQREQRKQELAFNARPFVLCGLPLRPLPKDQLVYKRRNGNFSLQIVAHPDYGLPFGQDRLIPIWVATLALRQKCRTVRFDSAAEILEFFRLAKDGRYYRRIVQGFQRIFASTMFFGTDEQPNGGRLIDWARFHFFDSIRLWFTDNGNSSPVPPDDHSNTITVSEAFYSEIDQHRVPMEREVVIGLANSPGVLDIYIWIAWRSWVLKSGRTYVPLFSPGGLKEQLGCQIHSESRFLRRKINQWLRVIRAYWPQCPAQISADGQHLVISSSKPSPALHPVQMPAKA